MKLYQYLPLFFFFSLLPLQAQKSAPELPWELKVNAGYNIGGTSPLPLPVEVREIKSYSPLGFAPHIALELTRKLDEKWGVSAQVTLDFKGFSVTDSVLNLHTEMEMSNEKYVGSFTGTNSTNIENVYLTVPVMASYAPSEKWVVQLGFYLGYLYSPKFRGHASDGYIRSGGPTGEKTKVDDAYFDFSDNQNTFDWGLQAAGEWKFSKRFAVRGQLAWGLQPIFPSDFSGVSFDMYNIYGTVGISYLLKKF